MKINISGTTDKRLQKYFMQMSTFTLMRLIPKNVLRDLEVNIEVQRVVEEGVDGYCDVEGYGSNNKPRSFTIAIKRNPSVRYMLMSLAHELVHVKQYALGELNDTHTRWRGTKVNDEEVNYWELPWEIEAHGRERGLITLFCEKFKYKFPKKHEQRDE